MSKGISSSEYLPSDERLRDPGLLSLEKVLEGLNSRLSINILLRTQRQPLYWQYNMDTNGNKRGSNWTEEIAFPA